MQSINSRCITLTVGIPASGKTTWALQSGFDVAISLDDCRQELWGDYTIQDGPGGILALLTLQQTKISTAMAAQQSIVVHNTHHLRAFRKNIFETAKKSGYQTRLVYFDINTAECRRRNRQRQKPIPEAVMDRFLATMEKPTMDEADEMIIFRLST